MKNVARLLALSIVVAIAAFGPCRDAAAQAMIVGFDTDPSGNPITAGMVLTSVFGGMTITRIGPGSSTGKVYATNDCPGDFGTPPLCISIFAPPNTSDFSETEMGMIQIAWSDDPPHTVCIKTRPNTAADYAVMRALDRDDNLLQEAFSHAGATETVCVSAFGMKKVRFAGDGKHNCRFDSLTLAGSGDIAPVGPIYLPAVARLSGLADTNWRTDVEIFNRSTSVASTLTLDLLIREQANPSPATHAYTIPPMTAIRLNDVLWTQFGVASGAATLRLEGHGGDPVMNGRTYNDLSSGTYGQPMEGWTLDQALEPSDVGYLFHVAQWGVDSGPSKSGFRTNLGIVNASPFTITVTAVGETADNSGSWGTKSYTLGAYESTQLTKWFVTELGVSAAVNDAVITLSSDTPGAHFFAYATVTDNKTGDSVFFNATRVRTR